MPRGGPIAVAIEQSADNPAVQDAGEGFVFFLRLPFGHDFIAANETANMKPFWIRGAATKAGVGRCVEFLERLGFAVGHDYCAPLPATDPGYGRNSGPV